MTASHTVSDRTMIAKPLKEMSAAERQMFRNRVEQGASALGSAVSPEYARMVALSILEQTGGLDKGTVDKLIDREPVREESSRSSVFARRSDNYSKRDFS